MRWEGKATGSWDLLKGMWDGLPSTQPVACLGAAALPTLSPQANCTATFRAPEFWDVPSTPCELDQAAADVWSAGCTLFALMYGQSPFQLALNQVCGPRGRRGGEVVARSAFSLPCGVAWQCVAVGSVARPGDVRTRSVTRRAARLFGRDAQPAPFCPQAAQQFILTMPHSDDCHCSPPPPCTRRAAASPSPS